MKLYLQRHCQPEPGMPMNGERKLTEEGIRQANECAAFMVRHIGRVDIVISSPFARALETAQIMAKALGAHVATTRMLEPDGKPDEMWAEIVRLAPQCKDVLVVGHDPSINELLCWMMDRGKDPDGDLYSTGVATLKIRFEHGAIAHMRADDDGDGKLHWFVDVKIIERDEVMQAAEALVEELTK